MHVSAYPATVDRDAARARYIAPGVLELRLRGRVVLDVLRVATRDLETLAHGYPGARQLLMDAGELVSLDRAVPGAMAQWLGAVCQRFDCCALVAGSEMMRVMMSAIAASVAHPQTFVVASRTDAFTAFDDALIRRALRPRS